MRATTRRLSTVAFVTLSVVVAACGREGSILPGDAPTASPSPSPLVIETPTPTDSPSPSPTAEPTLSPEPTETASPTREPGGSSNAGVQGSVRAGPDCPLEQQGSPCPEERVPGAEVRATPEGGGDPFTTTADAEGSFRLRLPPGAYELTASSPAVEDCRTQRVDVVAGEYRPVVISCTSKP